MPTPWRHREHLCFRCVIKSFCRDRRPLHGPSEQLPTERRIGNKSIPIFECCFGIAQAACGRIPSGLMMWWLGEQLCSNRGGACQGSGQQEKTNIAIGLVGLVGLLQRQYGTVGLRGVWSREQKAIASVWERESCQRTVSSTCQAWLETCWSPQRPFGWPWLMVLFCFVSHAKARINEKRRLAQAILASSCNSLQLPWQTCRNLSHEGGAGNKMFLNDFTAWCLVSGRYFRYFCTGIPPIATIMHHKGRKEFTPLGININPQSGWWLAEGYARRGWRSFADLLSRVIS